MNDRIKELALQAQTNGGAIHYYSPVFAEKFAELIVRECLRTLKHDECIQKLKEKFGMVEDDE